MTLAIFDLDNTLIGGDSDHSWGEYLIEQELVDEASFKKTNDQFYDDYKQEKLDIFAYQRFVLAELVNKSPEQLEQLKQGFMDSKITPILLPKAQDLIASHKEKDHTLLIITATNRFVTAPIAERLGIDHLLATEPEIINNHYTGEIVGIPCFREGKIKRLNAWLESQQKTYENVYFYSDSINDAPLLNEVDFPFAVDPDDKLRELAIRKKWPIISLR